MKATDLMRALEVVTRTQPEVGIAVEHDLIMIADYEETMPEEDKAALRELGWHEHEEAWAHFV